MNLERAVAEASVIFRTAVRAADPEVLVRGSLHLDGSVLAVGGRTYALPRHARLFVIAIGKAAVPMAHGALAALGTRIDDGLLVTKRVTADAVAHVGSLQVVHGSHPVPDGTSEEAGRRLLALARGLEPQDLVLVLISGGGSALVEAPIDGITLSDIAATTDALLRAGADIGALNAVRRRLSRLKGGGLARAIAPARVINLIISDVLGSPLPAIASGPTVADDESAPDPTAVVTALGVSGRIPAPVRAALAAPRAAGAPMANVLDSLVLADASTAARAASLAAQHLGYTPAVLATDFSGEAREFARFWAALARQDRRAGAPFPLPACLIGTGETTVTVRGRGIGGRNTEMATAAALAIEGIEGIAIASLATDGDDGLSDAAGGVVVGSSLARARDAGVHGQAALDANDTARFLAAAGGLLVTGPTGTNVNDLYLALLP